VPKRRKAKKLKRRIPEDHLDALLIFINKLMNTMGLPTYRILIMKKPADKGSIAEIRRIEDRYVAELYLCKDWLDRSDDEQRDTITHEILHLWHRGLTDWFYFEVQEQLHVPQFIKIEEQFHHVTELMVDHIAMILSQTHLLKEAWEEAHSASGQRADQDLEIAQVS
jgi:hypothetical protein